MEYGILKDVAVLQILAIGPKVTAGTGLFVITISSVEAGQGVLLMVHLKVAEAPVGSPVTVAAAELAELMVTLVPETKLHWPVPGEGAFAARLNVELLQFDISEPALAVLGGAAMTNEKGEEVVEHPLAFLILRVKL